MSQFLDNLLRASSVAVIGASDDGDKPSGRTIRYMIKYGYQGTIYPINPRRETVQGLKAYPSIGAIGEAPDLAVIVLPAAAVAGAVAECGKAGVTTAIVFSSGFSEVGETGEALEQELAATAKEYGVRVLGPNCVGAINAGTGLTAAFMTGLDQDRFALEDDGVAFVSQSGAMGAFILSVAQASGLGMGRFISTGNEADLSLPEVMSALVKDPTTKVILAYVEGIRNAPAFIDALREAQEAGVPVVMMKVGRSARGQAAAQSHTGALSGEDTVFDGIMSQFGVIRANSVDELIDAARAFTLPRRPSGPKTTIITLSGGAGVLMTDTAEEVGIVVDELQPAVRAELEAVLPDFASVANPVDVTGAVVADPDLLSNSLRIALADAQADSVMMILGNLEKQEDVLLPAILEAAGASDKPLIMTWVGGSGEPAKVLSRAGIPVYDEPVRAMKALAIASHWPLAPAPMKPQPLANHATETVEATGLALMDEYEGKQLLSVHGFPVSNEAAVEDADAAVQAADDIGYPVVVKLLSVEVGHKSDLGFVRVGLSNADEVREVAEEMLTRASTRGITDRRLLVQELVKSDHELILGMRHDESFGPVVMVGMGGIFAEILKDVQLAIPPITEDFAKDLINRLKLSESLLGARGRVAINLGTLAQAIVAFAEFATSEAERFESFEINPLLVRADGSPVAVDALGVLNA